jgi:hypothetical protein
MFGRQLAYVIDTFQRRRRAVDAGGGTSARGQAGSTNDFVRVVAQIVVSLVILATGCGLLFCTADADRHKIASGLIGLVAGYWLR